MRRLMENAVFPLRCSRGGSALSFRREHLLKILAYADDELAVAVGDDAGNSPLIAEIADLDMCNCIFLVESILPEIVQEFVEWHSFLDARGVRFMAVPQGALKRVRLRKQLPDPVQIAGSARDREIVVRKEFALPQPILNSIRLERPCPGGHVLFAFLPALPVLRQVPRDLSVVLDLPAWKVYHITTLW